MVTECCWVCPCETFVACRPHYVTLAGLLLWPAHCQTLARQLETRQFYWSAFAFYRPSFFLVRIRATVPPTPESPPGRGGGGGRHGAGVKWHD